MKTQVDDAEYKERFKTAIRCVVKVIVEEVEGKEKTQAWKVFKALLIEGRVGRYEAFSELANEAMLDITTASLAVGQTELVEAYIKCGSEMLKTRLWLIFQANNLVADLKTVLAKHNVRKSIKNILKFEAIEKAHQRFKEKGILPKDHQFGWHNLANVK